MRCLAFFVLALIAAPLWASTSPSPPPPPYPFMSVEEMSAGLPVAFLYDNESAAQGREFPPTVSGSQSAWLTIRVTSDAVQFGGGMGFAVQPPVITSATGGFALDASSFGTFIQVGTSTEFRVRFTPPTTGVFTATVTFGHEADPMFNPGVYSDFRVNVSGTGVSAAVPYAMVREGSVAGARVFSGQSNLNARDFKRRMTSAGPAAYLSLWVTNEAASGAGTLNLGTPTLSGAFGEFSLDLSQFVTSLSAGASTEIRVAFDPATVGIHQGTLTFDQDDGYNPDPYSITLNGEGLLESAQIRVSDAAGPFFDTTGMVPAYIGTHMDENAAPSGGRDFGNAAGTLTITVANADVGVFLWAGYQPGADLTLGTPTVVGDADFTVGLVGFNNTVASANTTTFEIHFNPQADGVRSAVIELPHGDASEHAPFRIHVTGVGVGVGQGGGGSGGGNSGGGCVSSSSSGGIWLFAGLLGVLCACAALGQRRRA
ncbi:MAG: choice-of-anchor D domain-containing protein [Planctomycetes bacterium]|nr:choice-of-anchor D domain-containing protein [Planctomycetota bacterium]